MKLETLARSMISLMAMLVMVFAIAGRAEAWPTDADWTAIANTVGPIGDIFTDSSVYREIVGNSTAPASAIFNDGTYIYYRIRLDDDPTQAGYLRPYGWGFLIDTDQNADYYEWMVMIDGIGDELYIAQNTVKSGTLGDPSDKAEVRVYNEPLDNTPGSENFKVVLATPTLPTSPDYFLEFRYPYDVWLNQMGLTETSVIRYFIGSSNQAQTLSADLVAGSTLYEGISTIYLPSGTAPTTGSVMFVTALDGTGDLTEIYSGDTIYIKVTDLDENSIASEKEQVTVVVTNPSGDSETVVLTETDFDNGIFTGQLSTNALASVLEDGTLQLSPVEYVTVTYIDLVDAAVNKNTLRTDTLLAKPSADLFLEKTVVGSNTPNEGDVVSFKLTLTNLGFSNATGIQVTDQLPAGLTYHSDDGGGAYGSGTHLWTVGSLNDGDAISLIINATVNAGTANSSITNDAEITDNDQLDPDLSNNTASVTITVQGADVGVTKTVDDPTPNPGDPITYTVVVTNHGAYGADSIVITDKLPTGLTYAGDDTGGAYSSATGDWTVGSLANGASATMHLQATVDDPLVVPPIIDNVAFINSVLQADPSGVNNTSTASIAVGGAELGLTKTVNNPAPNEGQAIFYTITLTNNGGNNATGVVVADTLPAGVLYTGDNGGGAFVNSTGLWTIGGLASGAGTSLIINATVKAGTGGTTIVNNASIFSSDQPDLIAVNDTASASFTVQSADLQLSKSIDNPAPNVGSVISYTVSVKNNGPSTATNVRITDNLPADIAYLSQSGTGTYYPAAGIWNAGTINVGSTVSKIINATVNAPALSTRTNTATRLSADQADPISTNNSASVLLSVGGIDMRVRKFVSNPTPAEGATITYIVNATNLGPNIAHKANLNDALPSGVTLVSSTSRVLPAGTNYGTYSAASGAWTFKNTEPIAVGQTVQLTLVVTVDAGTTGQTIGNTGRFVFADENDYNATNNQSTASITVGATDMIITKTVSDGTPNVGDLINFTVSAINNGPGIANNVSVFDLMPANLNAVSWSGHGTYNMTTGIWNCGIASDAYSIGVGLSNTITITAFVNASGAGQTLTNTASLRTLKQPDQNTSNNTASASVVVQSADLRTFKTADNATPYENATVKYTITVTNDGPHAVTAVTVKDSLPGGMTYINDNSGGLYIPATGYWTVGALAKNQSKSLIINSSPNVGTGGTTLFNIANITSSDVYDPDTSDDLSIFPIAVQSIPWPDILTVKSSTLISDPINGGVNPKAIPGAIVEYTIQVLNQGDGEAEAVVIADPIPANTEMYVGDLGSGPVIVTDPLPGCSASVIPSGLGYSYVSLGDGGDSLAFSNNSGASYVYTPTLGGGFDSQVTNLKVSFTNTFAVYNGADIPCLAIKFRVRVK